MLHFFINVIILETIQSLEMEEYLILKLLLNFLDVIKILCFFKSYT